jgi:hypothetical protein
MARDLTEGYEGRRPCTWLALTRQGHKALRAEVAALEQLVARLRRLGTGEAGGSTGATR